MATIQKRGDSYSIRVSCGYDSKGKQVIQSMTWKPEPKMTAKQIEKELNRQAVMFEEACNRGYQSKAIKFQEFAEECFKQYANTKLKTQTVRCYHNCEKKVYKALGHLRMDKITTRTIQTFIVDLAGEKRYDSKGEELQPYAPKTVRNYISFISSIFDYAVRMQVLTNNPCKNVVLPSKKANDREVYSLDEVQQMLELFENESEVNYKYTIFFTLAAFTGLRRGELLGLEWKDVDFEDNIISVRRTSNYTAKKGIYTDTPKTESSVRFIKLPPEVIQKLKAFQDWQNGYKAKLGTKWVECDRLFVKWNGEPMNNNTPYFWLREFCEANNFRFCDIHSLRHFYASALINKGVDAAAVSGALGHSTITTTTSIYCHVFNQAQARASEAIASVLDFKKSDNGNDAKGQSEVV